MKRVESKTVYEKALNVIPGGVNSPVRSFKGMGLTPIVVESGKEGRIKDVDGREYIDFCMSWGALILGHAHPQVISAVEDQLKKGSSFGTMTEIEVKIASKVVDLIDAVEKIRFVSSGTEATMTAIRLARAFTGRSKIIKFSGHYHGHHDMLLVQAGSGVSSINPIATSKGIPKEWVENTLVFPFNDFEKVRIFFKTNPEAKNVAAIILEPVAGNMGVVPPEPYFLEMLREETEKNGSLLIFDEVMTGFRVDLKGASHLFQIKPDLICFGKIIGGGFPAAAVGGRKEILDSLAPLGEVYQAGTLSGNPIAMRAGLETLKIIEEKDFYKKLSKKTNRLIEPVVDLLELKNANACIQGVGSMVSLFFGSKKVKGKMALDDELFVKFFRYLFDRGIYIPPAMGEAWFVSSSHTNEEMDYTLECIRSFVDTYL